MRTLLVVVALLVSASAFARTEKVTLIAGSNHFQPVPVCGPNARAKAVYKSQGFGLYRLTLRICDFEECSFPVLLNTNSSFEVSGDGKTEVFASEAEGIRENRSCYAFEMHNPTQTQKLRVKIGNNYFQNTAKITIE